MTSLIYNKTLIKNIIFLILFDIKKWREDIITFNYWEMKVVFSF